MTKENNNYIDEVLEGFNKMFYVDEVVLIDPVDGERDMCYGEAQYKIKDFIKQSLEAQEAKHQKVLRKLRDKLIDDKSLEDQSNGRYNREIELRNKIKEIFTKYIK